MNNRTLIYATCSGLIFLLACGLWIFLLLSTTHAEQASTALDTNAANDRAEEATLFSDAAVARDAVAPSTELSSLFASSSAVASVVETVEKSGTALGLTVSINSISTDPAATTSLSTLSMSVSASGSWNDILAFAATLESLPYDIALSKVSLFQNGGDPKKEWHIDADASSFVSN